MHVNPTAVLAAAKRQWRIGAAGLIGTVALVTLGAGSATAHGMVTSGEIKNQTISQADVGQGGVSGHTGTGNNEIEAQSVGQGDVSKGGVSGTDGTGNSEIELGSVGEANLSEDAKNALRGERGPQGPPGEDGQDGVSGYEVVTREIELDGSTDGTVSAPCPGEKVAVGGGYEIGGNNRDVVTIEKSGFGALTEQADGTFRTTDWVVRATPADTQTNTHPTVKAYVSCAAVN